MQANPWRSHRLLAGRQCRDLDISTRRIGLSRTAPAPGAISQDSAERFSVLLSLVGILSAGRLARRAERASFWWITRSLGRYRRRRAAVNVSSTSTPLPICPSEPPEQLGGSRRPGQLSGEWDTFYTHAEGWTVPGLTDCPSYYDEGRGGHVPRPDLYFRILGEAWPHPGRDDGGLDGS